MYGNFYQLPSWRAPSIAWRKAKELSMPKNKLIEQSLRLYLDHLTRAAYICSYKQMAEDADLLAIAEEGMPDYFEQLENK